MLIVLLLINLALLIFPTQTQIDPSWIRDVNIDAGESKAVVFDKCRTSSTPQVYNASAKFTYTQNYNKTDFKAVPKVALAQLSYDFFYLANATQLGYRISIIDASITNTSFKCSVQIVGVRVCGLHFMYIAILHTYDPFYMVQVYPYTCNINDIQSMPQTLREIFRILGQEYKHYNPTIPITMLYQLVFRLRTMLSKLGSFPTFSNPQPIFPSTSLAASSQLHNFNSP